MGYGKRAWSRESNSRARGARPRVFVRKQGGAHGTPVRCLKGFAPRNQSMAPAGLCEPAGGCRM